MKVTLKCGRVGPRGTQRAGDIIDLQPAEAESMVMAGLAEYCNKPPEAMVVTNCENAMLPKARINKPRTYPNSRKNFHKE